MYGIDPFDLQEAVKDLPQLTSLYVQRLPLNLPECQTALLNILQGAKKLRHLNLILPQLPTGIGVREWTQAFKSDSVHYLIIELSSGGVVRMDEARAIMQQMAELKWLIIKCNDGHVIEMNRTEAGVAEKEHLRLDTLDLPVMYPQLFDNLWFSKWNVSYFLFPNYTPDHMERFVS